MICKISDMWPSKGVTQRLRTTALRRLSCSLTSFHVCTSFHGFLTQGHLKTPDECVQVSVMLRCSFGMKEALSCSSGQEAWLSDSQTVEEGLVKKSQLLQFGDNSVRAEETLQRCFFKENKRFGLYKLTRDCFPSLGLWGGKQWAHSGQLSIENIETRFWTRSLLKEQVKNLNTM